MNRYYAHIAEDGRRQSVEDHLKGTAILCRQFASAFHSEDYGTLVGLAHDIGKYSDAFQKRLAGGKKVDHATAGAKECIKKGAIPAAMCVIGHHSGLPNLGNRFDRSDSTTFMGRIQKTVEPYSSWHDSLPSVSLPNLGASAFSQALWVKMLYSCLVDADYLDTEKFMNNTGGHYPYDTLPCLLDRFNTYINQWNKPTGELNTLRNWILNECTKNGNCPKGIYTLTVPTGGGKTVSSLSFALHHAVTHHLSRIIYVIPYTSIIEQNAEVFRNILGDNNVLEHHSSSSAECSEESGIRQYRNVFAVENWDAPVIVTTAVQFFESMFSNRSSKCRKLHNIANSVIIFDEAQMLPTHHLQPCVATISCLAERFQSTVVLCTATQPALSDIITQFAPGLKCRELCSLTPEDHQKFTRVCYRQIGKISDSMLIAKLCEEHQVLCIVNSRKAASDIYDGLPEDGRYHLSTLMCPVHRKSTLSEIRKRLMIGAPCRVISTSLIEAGVDIDFPAVYRELAGLDSIMQAAGRCNREGKRPSASSLVTVFEREFPVPDIFSIQVGAAKEVLQLFPDISSTKTISRYFSVYRDLIGNNIDLSGVIHAFEHGIDGCSMPFQTVAERFRMIDNDTMCVYIPWENGKQLIDRLESVEHDRRLYRQIGPYGVNIYRQHYRRLLDSGDIRALDDQSAILVNPELYSLEKGLSLSADEGKALFI